jgi:hypothetical protein
VFLLPSKNCFSYIPVFLFAAAISVLADTISEQIFKAIHKPETQISWDQLLKTADTARYLDLSFRDLDRVPRSISCFKKLRHLDLKGNSISVIPEDICYMTSLVILDLRGNRITSVPPHICNLTGLHSLLLTGNKIDETQLFHIKRALPETNVCFYPELARFVKDSFCQTDLCTSFCYCDSLLEKCSMGDCRSCNTLGMYYRKQNDMEMAFSVFSSGCDCPDNLRADDCRQNCRESAEILSTFMHDENRAVEYRMRAARTAYSAPAEISAPARWQQEHK